MGVLLACALALPQALARSAPPAELSSNAAADASRSARAAAVRGVLVAAVGATMAQRAPAAAEGGAFARGEHAGAARLFTRVAANVTRKLKYLAALRRLPPLAVRRVIAAGNRIARAPYIYGGGHGNWNSGGYDCSGSISYALHGGGLLDTAMASGGFMSWGDPGPGRWITIYANPGHAFMVVAGRRFDTTGREQTGSRWQSAMRDTSSYVVRHPPGL